MYGRPLKAGYQVSATGDIKTPYTDALSSGSRCPDGYYKKRVYFADGTDAEIGVHVLVCAAWHKDRPTINHTVDHLDGNKANNKPGNLKWATRAEQQANRVVKATQLWEEARRECEEAEEAALILEFLVADSDVSS